MCRIAGLYNPGEKNLERCVSQMRDAMKHGGPDDAGIYVHPELSLALGHRRLSLIDLTSTGHQPMEDPNTGNIIIFNGEIYNYKELRSTLRHYGYSFHSESDTEVILKAYAHWGIEALEFLNGMFAFALWSAKEQQLILARDHAGIKPLYYYLDQNCLYFASEIRAFHHSGKSFSENEQWKSAFLAFGHLPEPVTTLKNVIPLEKGTALIIEIPSLKHKVHRYFEWKFSDQLKTEADALSLIRDTLNESVKRHMISDAPIGLFLSGGIDSSLLTLIAAKDRPDNLHTLSIVFNEKKYSEEYYQNLIIQKTNAKHQSFLVTKDVFNAQIDDALLAMDQPSIDGINTYFISRFARQYGLKAVLSGLGADELFGGYPSFFHHKKARFFKKLPSSILKPLQYLPNHRLRKLSYAGTANAASEYLMYRGIFSAVAIAELLDVTEKNVQENLSEISTHYPIGDLQNGNRVSWIETNFYMQNQLLKDSDSMSMWHGLEIRVPFLDKEVMLMAGLIDEHLKFQKTRPKYLLVKSYEDILPEEIWNRKKQGFAFPFEGWLNENTFTKPSTSDEQKLYDSFKSGKLLWSHYWCGLLMNRFAGR